MEIKKEIGVRDAQKNTREKCTYCSGCGTVPTSISDEIDCPKCKGTGFEPDAPAEKGLLLTNEEIIDATENYKRYGIEGYHLMQGYLLGVQQVAIAQAQLDKLIAAGWKSGEDYKGWTSPEAVKQLVTAIDSWQEYGEKKVPQLISDAVAAARREVLKEIEDGLVDVPFSHGELKLLATENLEAIKAGAK